MVAVADARFEPGKVRVNNEERPDRIKPGPAFSTVPKNVPGNRLSARAAQCFLESDPIISYLSIHSSFCYRPKFAIPPTDLLPFPFAANHGNLPKPV